VTGPLRDPVNAHWRLEGTLAVVEMARASGLVLAGGRGRNDAMTATTRGTGELIAAALDAGARRIIVGVGGSATTDGGLGAVQVLERHAPFGRPDRPELLVACDVTTRFTDAAPVFAPQKGATEEQVALLRGRLEDLQRTYVDRYGVDVSALPGAGAAGGLAGGLAALGARLVPGFDLVADQLGLDRALENAHLVIAGEGYLDRGSFAGKVVGGVVSRAQAAGVPVLAVVGDYDPTAAGRLPAISLLRRFGAERAWSDTRACIDAAVFGYLTAPPARTGADLAALVNGVHDTMP
jgi:glycerate kinase